MGKILAYRVFILRVMDILNPNPECYISLSYDSYGVFRQGHPDRGEPPPVQAQDLMSKKSQQHKEQLYPQLRRQANLLSKYQSPH